MPLPRGFGIVMADTREVMEKKELIIEIMKNKFAHCCSQDYNNFFDGPIITNVSQCEI